MSERVKKLPVWMVGLLVAGALAFGATRAMATPAFLDCNPQMYNGGTCASQQECADNCHAIFGVGGWTIAQCHLPLGCCRCIL
jgi:hypothetical protein